MTPVIALDPLGRVIATAALEVLRPAAPAEHTELLGYWHSILGDGIPPNRDTFDPIRMAKILPNLFTFAIEGAREKSVRFGVHGTNIATILKIDLTQKRAAEFLDRDATRQVSDPLFLTCAEMTPVRQRFFSKFPGREHILVDRLILPLSRNGKVDYGVGSLVSMPLGDETELSVDMR